MAARWQTTLAEVTSAEQVSLLHKVLPEPISFFVLHRALWLILSSVTAWQPHKPAPAR